MPNLVAERMILSFFVSIHLRPRDRAGRQPGNADMEEGALVQNNNICFSSLFCFLCFWFRDPRKCALISTFKRSNQGVRKELLCPLDPKYLMARRFC